MLHAAPLAVILALTMACSREAAAGEDERPAPAAAPSLAGEGQGQASILVEVTGLRSAAGTVHAYLYASAEGFPNKFAKAAAHSQSSAIAGDKASLSFADLDSGEYAVFIFHDENGNGELDKSLIGFPQEGIGVSNLKLDRPQRPKWAKAKFTVTGSVSQPISIRYL